MDEDDELCLCFHVTKRKVWNYLRVEKPSRASQLTGCFGAGTGCGWCRWALARLFHEWQAQRDGKLSEDAPGPLPAADEYARQRAVYRSRLACETTREPGEADEPQRPAGGQSPSDT